MARKKEFITELGACPNCGARLELRGTDVEHFSLTAYPNEPTNEEIKEEKAPVKEETEHKSGFFSFFTD